MKLSKLLDLSRGAVISIVGAGGKTSFLFSLAEELRYKHKVLVTTTTKIYVPNKSKYDFMHMLDIQNRHCIREDSSKGIYVLGTCVNPENKIVGINLSSLKDIHNYFDYTLIEADGSRQKPIKGWKDDEPVVYNKTDITIGVLDVTVIGKNINNSNIHRLDKFIEITNARKDDLIAIEHLVSLVCHPKGLFKNSFGKKVLFINKVENYEDNLLSNKIINAISNNAYFHIDTIILGSLFDKVYRKV